MVPRTSSNNELRYLFTLWLKTPYQYTAFESSQSILINSHMCNVKWCDVSENISRISMASDHFIEWCIAYLMLLLVVCWCLSTWLITIHCFNKWWYTSTKSLCVVRPQWVNRSLFTLQYQEKSNGDRYRQVPDWFWIDDLITLALPFSHCLIWQYVNNIQAGS